MWVNPEDRKQTEVSQTGGDRNQDLTYRWNPRQQHQQQARKTKN